MEGRSFFLSTDGRRFVLSMDGRRFLLYFRNMSEELFPFSAAASRRRYCRSSRLPSIEREKRLPSVERKKLLPSIDCIKNKLDFKMSTCQHVTIPKMPKYKNAQNAKISTCHNAHQRYYIILYYMGDVVGTTCKRST